MKKPKRPNLLVYVAGPYTAPTKKDVKVNIQKAEHAAVELILHGLVPIIPHKVLSFFESRPQFKDTDQSFWLINYNFPMIEACSSMFLCNGWELSSGCQKEIDYCNKIKKPYFISMSTIVEHYATIMVGHKMWEIR